MTEDAVAAPTTEAGRTFDRDYRNYGFLDRILAIEAEAVAKAEARNSDAAEVERLRTFADKAAKFAHTWHKGYRGPIATCPAPLCRDYRALSSTEAVSNE